MQVCYILRHPESHFYSIERLCRVLVGEIRKQAEVFVYAMPFTSSVLGAPANLLRLPKKRNTIYHIIGDVHYASLALPKERTVVTFHDTVSLHRLVGLKRHLVLEYSYRKPIERAAAVTTISQFAKSELDRACGGLDRPVHVVHNPADPVFLPVESKQEKGPRITNGKANGTLLGIANGKGRGIGRPIILQVGSLPHKNADTVIKALAGGDCDLHIVGYPEEYLIQLAAKFEVRLHWHTRITDRELVDLYAAATLVTFASAYEGFGLPVIEAQAVGCPVITSTCCSLPEVAGDGALFVEPGNVQELRSAVQRVLQEPALRDSLIERGRRNVARFNVRKIASEYLAIYESLLKQMSN